MIVVDTNIVSYLYISGERSEQAELLLSQDADWQAPFLWRSEFRSVLSQYLRKNLLTLAEALLIMQQAEQLLNTKEYNISSSQVLQLVSSSGCSAYDCEFVALAQFLNKPLITADKKIIREFPAIAISVDAFLAKN